MTLEHGDPRSSPFDNLLGTRFLEMGPDRVVAELEVTPKLHQPAGIVHGAVHCALVEHVASTGAFLWLTGEGGSPDGRVVGITNHTDFLRAVSHGVLTATGLPAHRGRTVQLWEVGIVDEHGNLVARGSVRLMNLSGSRDGEDR
jgi:1,4-dihydroxy-2-naphthoyl-CoA hydrolase